MMYESFSNGSEAGLYIIHEGEWKIRRQEDSPAPSSNEKTFYRRVHGKSRTSQPTSGNDLAAWPVSNPKQHQPSEGVRVAKLSGFPSSSIV